MQAARTLLAYDLPAALWLATALVSEASPSNKWHLEFSGGADSDVEIASNAVKGVRIHPERE